MYFNGNHEMNRVFEPAFRGGAFLRKSGGRLVGEGSPQAKGNRGAILPWVLRGLGAALLAAWSVLPVRTAEPVDFNFQVRPLLSDRCYACHGPDARARKAGLRLDTREGLFQSFGDGTAIVKPGDPANSELVRRILAEDPDDVMPPPDSHRQLNAAEKALLKRWVESGAAYQEHWAFVPVKPVEVPLAEPGVVGNAIDAFVRASLAEKGLRSAPEADRSTLLRRLALGLTGLPPTPEEQDAFLADDSTDAYERAVDRYLVSPAYGERMALDWLDLARYADTYGYQNDVTRDVSAWRDWVIRAFNTNLPYSQFLLWQIAGDLLPEATADQRLATAFNRLYRQTNEGGSIEEEFRTTYVADRVDTFGTAMLGMTLGCARCHDHKYDPVTQRDYYSLFAFFNNIDESGLYSHFTRATPTPTLLLWPEGKQAEYQRVLREIAAVEAELDRLAEANEPRVAGWQRTVLTVATPPPLAWFPLDAVTNHTTADAVTTTNVAKLVDGPILVSGRSGMALQFSGDNSLVCDSVPAFHRTDAFSLDLWLRPGGIQERAVVLHQSRAWTDSGSRGFELRLDGGRPSFSLIHFWPGNALSVEATQSLPAHEWSQLTITYDGSSRAVGVGLFLNGAQIETRTVRDKLRKDIVHRGAWGDSNVGGIHLTLAGRFRDEGFKEGCIDELKVFERELTAAEVALLAGREPQGEAVWREQYLARVDPAWQAARARLQELRKRESALIEDVPEIMVMEELTEVRPAFVLKRGAYDAPGDPVKPDTPESLLPFPDGQPRDRLGLARWLVDRRNPLAARVAVNRIWTQHFGRGIVATPEDFGSQGRLPSHPGLLDWLAGWFMDHDWDLKALHRLIVTSATYRQSSDVSPELAERDPDNQWLARGPKQQLLAEQIRDSALAASGLLCRSLGGPSVKPVQPEGLWREAGVPGQYTPDQGDSLYRRSLYTFWRRTAPPPNMLTFDATSREVCTARREVTVTPLQALVVLNDPQFVEAARVLAERLVKQEPDAPAARIPAVWRALLARLPDDRETVISRQVYEEQLRFFEQHPEGAVALLKTGAAPWDEALPAVDVAATTLLVSAVMNLDEFVVLR
jgi:mono/diheme cytochrome c family protein